MDFCWLLVALQQQLFQVFAAKKEQFYEEHEAQFRSKFKNKLVTLHKNNGAAAQKNNKGKRINFKSITKLNSVLI